MIVNKNTKTIKSSNADIIKAVSGGGILWQKEEPWKNLIAEEYKYGFDVWEVFTAPDLDGKELRIMEIKANADFYNRYSLDCWLEMPSDKNGKEVRNTTIKNPKTGISRIICERPIVLAPINVFIVARSNESELERMSKSQLNQKAGLKYRIIE